LPPANLSFDQLLSRLQLYLTFIFTTYLDHQSVPNPDLSEIMETGIGTWLDWTLLESLIYHVLLPPKCPHQREENLDDINSCLLRLALECAVAFVSHLASDDAEKWQPIIRCLSQWRKIQQGAALDQDKLEHAIKSLILGGEFLPSINFLPN
jgi:hypothetical protein